MRGSGDSAGWYTRKLENAKAPGVTNRVLRATPEHLHGILSVASEPSNRVPPLTDFRGETMERK